MSLILPSTSSPAPAPAPSPNANASTRYDEQGQNNSGSFGEALARSLEPAGEKTDKPAVKAAAAQPARRQAAPPKSDAQDLANAMVLALLPIETRMAQVALPVGTKSATESAVPGTTLASLNDLLTRAPALTNGTNGAADAPEAPEAAADADAQARLASVLAAASQNSAGQTPLPTSLTPVTDGTAIQLDPLAMAAQARAAGTGSSDPSSKRDDKAAPTTPGVLSDARADLAPAAPHGAPKVAASATEPTTESAARSVARSPVAADAAEPTAKSAAQSVARSPVAEDATASASTALQMTPATAALQAPVSVAATNAPIPAATASVMPELGSPEWGKALSQQVVHMGHAGQQLAELQLNPPGLGPLKVTLSMNDHQIQAMFVSAHSSVRAAVEAALPQLRATLAESGISLGNTSVGAESQPQTAFANGQDGQRDRETYRPAGMDNTATLLPARTVTEPVQRNSGMRIDTYA